MKFQFLEGNMWICFNFFKPSAFSHAFISFYLKITNNRWEFNKYVPSSKY
eukprot:c4634_g1_i1 orf=37-186(-)